MGKEKILGPSFESCLSAIKATQPAHGSEDAEQMLDAEESPAHACPMCKGSGYQYPRRAVICPECCGTGWKI